jgi:hypothetical protein
MKMDSAPASQTLLALSVKNVLMDFIDFQNVKTVVVIKKELTVLNVTMKLGSAPASQTLSAISVKIVRRDFLDSQIVKRTTLWSKF